MSPAPTLVKICGLSTAETLEASLAVGVDLIGLVHFPKSPRHVDLAHGAALSRQARGRAERVALLVDPDDALVEAVIAALDPDWLQLHGAESPERVAALRLRTGRPVMKALGIATVDDLVRAARYAGVADRLLFDAKPAPGAVLPGGNGHAFDWSLLEGRGRDDPFMLSGGLTPETVAEALAVTAAQAVDVSSGVESSPGRKDPDRIAAFVAVARATAGSIKAAKAASEPQIAPEARRA
ncbi:N-(5'-phosphoribosyl)anthranilate isomerase [Methylobacterium tarhaniae]|uniref:N-(5'-phosphoribosyl)anthranilate isomerase n=1 Tax=Methylobacterium tarhaniae TaxID=1187852 RepID=A0A0J6SMD5_9HYPH|nr:phosphoribosylanthranilate isomerase [Methylobacterium tarhaniae]KMO34538.1 N-(5'-phosphoribosyl)anthranilate isomerase [Methylobacterium tarhaniae]